ncbi:MAG: (2Fe-2S)-binding protein [Ruminococcus sp.]|nr:(2Fe-2S)-binding protein [Ruminococcus sp.]
MSCCQVFRCPVSGLWCKNCPYYFSLY